MSDSVWNEVTVAKEENRHELILSGPSISDRIQKAGLDPALFALTGINFLSITDTCLGALPDDISNLVNLQNLVLHSNKLTKLPTTVSALSKLKNVDVSRNSLESFPSEVKDWPQIYSVNLSFNSLTSFPSIVNNTRLSILDLSNNHFEVFPDICHPELAHLAEVKLNSNRITSIPHNIGVLPVLRLLDLSENKIKDVPGELADISKLKELNLKDNPLSDKRLGKLVIQCHSKQVLDYIRQHGKRDAGSGNAGKGKKKGNRKATTSESAPGDSSQDPKDVGEICQRMEVLHVSDDTPLVELDTQVKSVRPYIVCCIVRGITFTPESFQKFIKIQTVLHDTLCNKRQAATLATHDLSALAPGPLKYVARAPDQVKLQPLGSTKETLASKVFARLQSHAHAMMMDRKRSKYSGIHKFLYLLEGKSLYPFLIDSAERVASFPPLTNSNITKMSVDSKAMFVEVTSSTSLAICRKVMDSFLLDCLRLGIGGNPEAVSAGSLVVEQVRVIDTEGVLQVVYPSRNDLVFEEAEKVTIIRNY